MAKFTNTPIEKYLFIEPLRICWKEINSKMSLSIIYGIFSHLCDVVEIDLIFMICVSQDFAW